MEYILGVLLVLNTITESIGLPELLHLFSAVIFVWYLIRRKPQIKNIIQMFFIMTGYVVLVQLITQTNDIYATSIFLIKALLNITLTVWVVNNYQEYELRNVVYGAAIVQGIATVCAFIMQDSILWKLDEYVTGTKLHRLELLCPEPAYLSFISGLLLIIGIYQILVYKISWQLILAGVVILINMLLSYGMGGMICLVFAIAVMLMAHVAKNRDKIVKDPASKNKWILTGAMMIVVMLSIIILSPAYGFRFASVAQGTDVGLTYVFQHPLTVFTNAMHLTNWHGVGIGQLVGTEISATIGLTTEFKNSFLYIMSEGGFLGVALVVIIVGVLLGYVLLYGGILSLALFLYVTLYQVTAGRFDDPVNWIVYGLILAQCLKNKELARKEDRIELDNSRTGEVVVGIIGAKGLGNYGGYETFVDKLTEYHVNNANIKYLIACKANGQGAMDETKLKGAVPISDSEFTYHNAHCFKVNVPQIGAAQAIVYDLLAAMYCIRYFRKHKTEKPILYVLTCRIGPFIGLISSMIHDMGGLYYVNPDGNEWRRSVWNKYVRKYWKLSEKLMIKHADLVICDSKNIETYINATYDMYNPNTTYIAYGAEVDSSNMSDADSRYQNFLQEHGINEIGWLIVGRFVPENNFETMIREFMKSNSKKNLIIITNVNKEFWDELEDKLHFTRDRRVKFVGTVYDQALLKKIRENAYGYFHGHSVGGTNPSLLEALGSTKLNLLLDVGFNRECGEDGALYWSKDYGNLAALIEKAENLTPEEIDRLGNRAKDRIREAYSWQFIADRYEHVFVQSDFQ
ncbi:beta 1-4 rhamnosyltransferase Cps2T [Butyrivibrio sp. NC2002]|uniref:beta 1-4 rhamnosyltransferase Cps2T n=1 Tax=Butyrivibrio sp. NC2002 TaxID=1410610 RepID=UPI000AA3F269|nr:DUF1972 domain-containing protein [Butyrivibrio sp. NC2002]